MKEYGADVCFSKPLPLPQLKEEVARLLGIGLTGVQSDAVSAPWQRGGMT